MRALIAKGAYSWLAQTIVPSTTLPSHMSMLTGYLPARRIVFSLPQHCAFKTEWLALAHPLTT